MLSHVYCANCGDRFFGGEEDKKGEKYYCSFCLPKIKECYLCGDVAVMKSDKWEYGLCNKCKKEYSVFPNRWLTLRFKTFMRDNFTCRYCGRSPLSGEAVVLHCDHIIARSKGGWDDIENLVTSCAECNEGKMDILLDKYHENLVKNRRRNSDEWETDCI